jgi:tetratricopeptide (TPR) repeat protein
MTQMTIERAMQIAVGHHQAGRLNEAEAIYRQVLTANGKNAIVLQLLGTLLGQKGDLRGGEEILRRSLAIDPLLASAYFNLGEMCRRQGRPGEALATIMEGIRYRPNKTGYENLAAALRDLKHDEAAIDAMRTAIKFEPGYAPGYLKLGIILSENGRTAEAMEALKRAASLQLGWEEPRRQLEVVRNGQAVARTGKYSVKEIQEPRTCIALSAALTQLHRYDEAIEAAERASELEPNNGEPLTNLGWLYSVLGRRKDGIAACQRAIALNPTDGPAYWNMGLTTLLQGDFARGWELHEWRKKCPGFKLANYPQPHWNGERLAGKRILLWYEQGFGDTMQFVRYVPKVAALGAKIVLSVQPELRRLIEGSIAAERFAEPGQGAADADFQCALMSLPFVFKTNLETIPREVPYLAPPGELVERWRGRMTPYANRLRVGITWAGRVGHINDAMRSMHARQLAPLASTGVAFFSLQKWRMGLGVSEPEASMQMIDWTGEFADLADTAALVANLDLVIAVDTAVTHLAGAMGKPVWLLLPKAPDWRWLLDREDSPWYPTMRIFRQEKLGDWDSVVARVAGELKSFRA